MTTAPTTITIRPMEAPDVEALAGALGWPHSGIRARWVDAEAGRREIFVAEYEGGVAGSVSVNMHPEAPDELHLFALDVSPLLQRRGIGTALVGAVEDEAARRGMRRVWLDVGVENPDARRLYERLGYAVEGETVTLRYSVPNPDGSWRDVEEVCHRMFRTLEGTSG